MNKEWSNYFQYICSLHSGEIAELLKDTEVEMEEEKKPVTMSRLLWWH